MSFAIVRYENLLFTTHKIIPVVHFDSPQSHATLFATNNFEMTYLEIVHGTHFKPDTCVKHFVVTKKGDCKAPGLGGINSLLWLKKNPQR